MYAPDTTLCLVDFEDGIYDITGKSNVNINGVSLSSNQTKYHGNSAYFNYINKDGLIIKLPEEAKTVSFWFYPTEENTSGWYPTVWSSQSSHNSGGTYTHISDGSYSEYPQYRVNDVDTYYNNGVQGATIIERNQWHHFAYCYEGNGVHRFFLNGITQATITKENFNTLNIIAIGGLLGNSNTFVDGCHFSGYIGEILITSDCLWVQDFDIPTEKYQWTAPVIPSTTIKNESNYGTYYGSILNITDSDESTYWWTNQPQETNQYILFSFSNPVTFNGLTSVTTTNIDDCISNGTILQTSSDGKNWNTVGYFSGEPVCAFSNLNVGGVSYIRIYVETSSNRWLCLNEIVLDYVENSTHKLYVKTDSWNEVKAVYKKINGMWINQEYYKDIFDKYVNYITQI